MGQEGVRTDVDLVLIVDDEAAIRETLSVYLSRRGCETMGAASAEEAVELMSSRRVSAALVDVRLPGIDGIEVLGHIRKSSPDTEVIIMTSYASLDTVIEAMRKEAYDFLQKPFAALEEVWITVKRALEKRALSLRNRKLFLDLELGNRALAAAVKRQNSLIDAGRAMGAILALPELLDFFVGVVAKELEVDRVSLMLLDEASQEMGIVASRGLSEDVIREVRLKPGEGIAGWVAREGKPVLVKDVENDPRIKESLKTTKSASFISAPIVLSVPILLREKVMGVINVTNRRTGLPFEEEDMAFLCSLAGQAAVAIESARKIEELRDAYESLKTAQKHLVDSERLKALGLLAAGVAHDFNNLLTGILGRAQILRDRIDAPETDLSSVGTDVDVIEKLALQGAGTVRRIQEATRIRKDVPSEIVDLNAVVRDAVEATRGRWKSECESRGVHIRTKVLEGAIPPTQGCASELKQVVCNLVFNAVDAMPEGGDLTLRTFSEGDAVVLEVSDTGIGMSKEVQERIFQPFFTTKESGHGLGTSIVYGIVARHGGEIRVSSEEGAGATFRLSLPVVPVAPGEEEAGRSRAEKKPAPAKVLVVEDNELNRKLFETFLSGMGHKTLTASNGKEAQAILDRVKVDLVITDLSMPGLSGWQVAEMAKKRDPRLPVILVSGWAVQQDGREIRQSGVDFILQKPCTTIRFREAVDAALRTLTADNG